jgi:hypothetical protein
MLFLGFRRGWPDSTVSSDLGARAAMNDEAVATRWRRS